MKSLQFRRFSNNGLQRDNKSHFWDADFFLDADFFATFLQIVFEAVRGSGGDKGDIAIDDVSIKNGRCPNPGRPFVILSDGITGFYNS